MNTHVALRARKGKTVIILTAIAVLCSLLTTPALATATVTTVSVKDFGATGNGSTDDTAAIQRAIDAVPAGGTLSIPAGTYLVGRIRVTSPMSIVGVGTDSLLRLRSGANTTLLSITDTRDVAVSDLAIDGNLTGQTGGYPHGIQFTRTTDSSVTRVDIRNCEKSAVSVYDGSDRVSVTYSVFYNNENDVEIHSSAYNYCANNYAENTQYEAWVSYEQVGGPGKAHHNTIVNNISVGAYAGINIERSHDDVVQGNTIENAQWGIMVQGRDSTYSYNTTIADNILRGGANSIRWGITVENPSHDNVIARNTVSGWHGTPLNIESANTLFEGNIITDNDKAVPVKSSNVIVRNNVFRNSGEVGVQFTAAAHDVVFEGNLIEGSAEEGVLILEPMTRLAFLRNEIKGNGSNASGAFDGVHSIAQWNDSAFMGNRIYNVSGMPAQNYPVNLRDGSTIAVAGNELSGLRGAQLPTAATGSKVTVAAAVSEIGVWTCTAGGRPGVWTLSEPGVLAVPNTDIKQLAIQGSNRFATNVAVSQAAFPNGADVVLIATGANWPDALGGATLAAAAGGPILLAGRDGLPSVVLSEIRRLGATRAIILGGESAVGAAVERTLRSELASVSRIGGSSRYDTAAAIARASVKTLGASYDGTVLLATGSNFADALAVSPITAAKGWPLLIVGPGGISDLQPRLDALGVNEIVVLGGTNAVPASVEAALKARYGSGQVTRLNGANRYATSSAIANWAVNDAGLQWDDVAIATGENFPDALAGGVLQGLDGSVLLLTPGTYLHADTRLSLAGNRADISSVKYFGGQTAVSQTVRNSVVSALQ